MSDAKDVAFTAAGMRVLLRVAAVLVFIIGTPLIFASTDTETWFAWTIATPLTAAFLGGSYWAAGILEWMASREERWSHARVAVPAVFLFTVITFIVTLAHIDKFHLAAPAAITRVVAWSWLVIYGVVPLLMIAAFLAQRRAGGTERAGTHSLPGGLRAMLFAQGGILLIGGLALLLATAAVASYWPWNLTPLTARAIGAWLFSLGIAVIYAAVENEGGRVRPVAAGYLTLAVLQFVALARFASDFAWGTAQGLLYVAFLCWIGLAAGWMLALSARSKRAGEASGR